MCSRENQVRGDERGSADKLVALVLRRLKMKTGASGHLVGNIL
jgi:hypothetical protein